MNTRSTSCTLAEAQTYRRNTRSYTSIVVGKNSKLYVNMSGEELCVGREHLSCSGVVCLPRQQALTRPILTLLVYSSNQGTITRDTEKALAKDSQ